jgi:hypothetical protein
MLKGSSREASMELETFSGSRSKSLGDRNDLFRSIEALNRSIIELNLDNFYGSFTDNPTSAGV